MLEKEVFNGNNKIPDSKTVGSKLRASGPLILLIRR